MLLPRQSLCVLIVLGLGPRVIDCCDHRQRRSLRQKPVMRDVKDRIVELQCYARCERPEQCSRDQCKKDVMLSPRRGHCPSGQPQRAVHLFSCLDNCKYDFDCPAVQKCCGSPCGSVCMDAVGVRDDAHLPPIPKILNFKLPRSHKVEITIQSSANSTYYCHVEARSHIGTLFSPRKLGAWQSQPVEKIAEISDTKSKRTDVAFHLRPGRWYQVRVAAINANGFRGYSEPSEAFKLLSHPQPPKPPAEVRIASAQLHHGFYAVSVVWCPAKSSLPIEKYKIIWSLYVKSKDESLISNEAYVKDANQFTIEQLLPDSSYYIQVQAMSISGSRRLKSDKKSVLYNTSTPVPLATYASPPLKCATHLGYRSQQSDLEHLSSNSISKTNIASAPTTTSSQTGIYEVRFRLNRKFGMIVQISGFHPHKEKVYELCPKETDCEPREYSAIRAKKDSLEFSKLKYNTTYMLKALRQHVASVDNPRATAFTFTTPKCDNFRKRFPKMHIKCWE